MFLKNLLCPKNPKAGRSAENMNRIRKSLNYLIFLASLTGILATSVGPYYSYSADTYRQTSIVEVSDGTLYLSKGDMIYSIEQKDFKLRGAQIHKRDDGKKCCIKDKTTVPEQYPVILRLTRNSKDEIRFLTAGVRNLHQIDFYQINKLDNHGDPFVIKMENVFKDGIVSPVSHSLDNSDSGYILRHRNIEGVTENSAVNGVLYGIDLDKSEIREIPFTYALKGAVSALSLMPEDNPDIAGIEDDDVPYADEPINHSADNEPDDEVLNIGTLTNDGPAASGSSNELDDAKTPAGDSWQALHVTVGNIIYLASSTLILSSSDQGRTFSGFTHSFGKIEEISSDGDGNLFVLSKSGDLYFFNGQNYRQIKTSPDKPEDKIIAMHVSRGGGGVFLLGHGSVYLTKDKGVTVSKVNSIDFSELAYDPATSTKNLKFPKIFCSQNGNLFVVIHHTLWISRDGGATFPVKKDLDDY
ncbi:MAG: hypothetical protein HQK54_10830 [Oligoflexales bacterium]|nr:hypothetical protein [Oligoflexales bacterium]